MRRQIVCYVIMVTLTRHFPYNAHDECVVWMVVAFFMRLLFTVWYPLFTVLMLYAYIIWCNMVYGCIHEDFTHVWDIFQSLYLYQWPTIQCCCIMGWINLEAYKKLTTERPKNIYLQSNIVKIKHISNIWWTTIKRGQIGQQQMTQIWRA